MYTSTFLDSRLSSTLNSPTGVSTVLFFTIPLNLFVSPKKFATYVYQYASDEMLEESSFAALIIVLAGLGPVIFLSRTLKNILVKQIN